MFIQWKHSQRSKMPKPRDLRKNTPTPQTRKTDTAGKNYSVKLLLNILKDFGIDHRICRFHNVYGPYGTWQGEREEAPAVLCRKIIEAKRSGNHVIEV